VADGLLEAKLSRLRYLKELQEQLHKAEQVQAGTYRPPWKEAARPDQEPPPGEWFVWLILAGRGWGKTRTASEWAIDKGLRYPGCRIALVASTIADSRDTMVEGEALALDTLVPTPDGYMTMSQICAGDVVFGGDGSLCTVTEAFPVLHDRYCYKLRFRGGGEVVADAEHKWLTEDWKARNYPRHKSASYDLSHWHAEVITTTGIKDSLYYSNTLNHGVHVSSAHYSGPGGDIDPYVLGAWLGDGTAKSGAITSADPQVIKEIEHAGYSVRVQPSSIRKWTPARVYGVLGLHAQLKELGVISNKHIPPDYLYADESVRLALLQGLMDTDGTCFQRSGKGNGLCQFVSINKDLADGVTHLATSLGIRANVPRPKLTRIGTTHWIVQFTTTLPVFRLHRKLDRLPEKLSHSDHWKIQSVEPVLSVPVRCIAVDSPDHTFLITKQHIRTHNSGILNCLKPENLRGGSEENAWNRSLVELFLANGSRMKGFSSEKPRKLRGPQFNFAVADEAAFWTDAFKGTITDTTWSNLAIATRLPRRYDWPTDYRSQIVVATTPRPVALLSSVDPDPARAGLMQRESTIITRGRTVDNLDNLSEQYRANVIAPLLGTRLGRQELDAELLEDRSDALWRREWIDSNRVAPAGVPELVRVVVAVDPAVSDGETAAETGIVVTGADRRGHGYVLGDYTLRGTPQECMTEAIRAYKIHEADRIVAEINNGGDYIGALLRTIDPDVPYRTVRATRGKQTRAEPVSALYEQERVHHVGQFSFLEDQLCQWSPLDEESPDRLDALVWGFTSLHDLVQASWSQAYGVIKCGSCNGPIFKVVNGVERKKCFRCGALLKTEEDDMPDEVDVIGSSL
jgi:phage terminase large subunit-like protein